MKSHPDPRTHVIYRGCAHPATYFGVPMVPLILSVMVIAPPGFWAMSYSFWLSLGIWLLFVPVWIVLRGISRKDPYALLQLGLRARMRMRGRNRKRWGAVTHSPFKY